MTPQQEEKSLLHPIDEKPEKGRAIVLLRLNYFIEEPVLFQNSTQLLSYLFGFANCSKKKQTEHYKKMGWQWFYVDEVK